MCIRSFGPRDAASSSHANWMQAPCGIPAFIPSCLLANITLFSSVHLFVWPPGCRSELTCKLNTSSLWDPSFYSRLSFGKTQHCEAMCVCSCGPGMQAHCDIPIFIPGYHTTKHTPLKNDMKLLLLGTLESIQHMICWGKVFVIVRKNP